MVTNTNKVTVWKSKGLSDENIKPPSTSNNSFNLGINYTDSTKIQVKFDGTCLKQEKLMFTHKKLVNMDILYETNLLPFTVGKLTIKADLNKYTYSGCGIGFDAGGSFPSSNGSSRFRKNVVKKKKKIFGDEMSSSLRFKSKMEY